MGNPLLGNLMLPEKGDLCPHCGKIDTHIGYVCPQIGAIDFDSCSGVTRIEYRLWPYQPWYYPQASGLPGVYPHAGAPIPCYTHDNPRPRYDVTSAAGPLMPYEQGVVGVCGGIPTPTVIPNGGWLNTAGWTAGEVNSI